MVGSSAPRNGSVAGELSAAGGDVVRDRPQGPGWAVDEEEREAGAADLAETA